jgi:hypothetical protein
MIQPHSRCDRWDIALAEIRKLTSLALLLVSLPGAAFARDVKTCANLYRQLANAPQIIGTSGEMRQYAQDLGRINADIRQLRIDMRRQRCGGSIVTLGGASGADICGAMQDDLRGMEEARAELTRLRNGARSLSQPSEERVALLATIRRNNCTPSDLDAQDAIDQQERIRIRGIALPEGESGSSITHLGGRTPVASQPEAIEFPPERPYDPGKKVRMVGPRFLPEEDIDLANPKLAGPQPQQ